MDRLTKLRQRLSDREKVIGTIISNLSWSGIVEKYAYLDFDFVTLDLEHGTMSPELAEEMLRTARLVDMPTVVRVGDAVPHLISKTLDMGADGIILPRVETVTQVETAVRAMRFAPVGRKGCGGFSQFRKGETMEAFNQNRLLLIQIESDEGIDQLPQILEHFGGEIAGVLIGPYDMSTFVGVPQQIKHPVMLERVKQVFSVCHKAKKACGIFVDGAHDLAFWNELGCEIFWTGTELGFLCKAAGQVVETFRSLE